MPARTALGICCAALVIGLVGDQLLRSDPWGAGAALWLLVSIGSATFVIHRTRQADAAPLTALLLTAAFFGLCLAWRDASGLKGWNVLAAATALTLGLLQLGGVALRAAGLLDYVAETAVAALRMLVGPLALLASGLTDRATAVPSRGRRIRAIVLGVVLAIPVLVVFGALLVSADPVFERLARLLFDWDFEQLFSHLVLIVFLSWIAAGYLRSIVARDSRSPRPSVELQRPRLSALEVGIPLGALTVLFLAFIVVQARYLFGSEQLIRTTVGLTYAEYARRGFFELVAVAGLVLPLLMVADWATDAADHVATRVFRTLAAVALVLVGLIIASAAIRLRLYRDAYGLTQDRLYAAAVMAWIAAALGWFGATVLRRRHERFMLGAITAGLAVVAAMNLLNPDAVIARTNLARAAEGEALDADYLASLSADAGPTLVAALPALGADDRCTIVRSLTDDYRKRQDADWRSWSLGRSRADNAFRASDTRWTSVCTDVAPQDEPPIPEP